MNKEVFEAAVKIARHYTDEIIIDSYQDHANNCTVLVTESYKLVRISNLVIMQQMGPRKDPFIEAFKAIVLNLHEYRKANDYPQADEQA